MLIRLFCLLIVLVSSPALADNEWSSIGKIPDNTKTAKAIIPIYSQKIAFQMPINWKPAFKDQNASSFMMEFTPENETIENWSEMFTIMSIKNASGKIPLSALIQNTVNNHKKVCKEQLVYEMLGTEPINGYKTLRAIIGCASMPNNHSDSSKNNISEFAYFIAIQGKKDIYMIHKSRRGNPFDVSSAPITNENVEQYISKFLPIELCENTSKKYECIK